MNRALDVARYVINYSNERDYGISNLKLQKIMYFIQAYFLAYEPDHDPCFPEKIEAWDFGPVIPDVYHEFKQYGSGNIPRITSYIVFNEDALWNVQRKDYDPNIICERERNMIDAVVDRFSDYSASDLVELTHHQAPWKEAYRQGRNCEITQDSIRRYFA